MKRMLVGNIYTFSDGHLNETTEQISMPMSQNPDINRYEVLLIDGFNTNK